MDLSEQDLFEQGPVILMTWDLSPGWPVISVTNNISQLGYNAADFLTNRLLFAEIVLPDDLVRVNAEVGAYLASNAQQFEQDYRIVTPEGQIRWIYDKTVIVYSDQREPIQARGYLLDITERKESEQKLIDSHDRYYQLFNANKAIQLLIDPGTGLIVQANQAAEQFYGYNQADFKQLHISDINTLSRENIGAEMRHAISEERSYFNFQHKLKNGELKDVCVYSGPIQFAGKALLYSIVHDVTQQRQTEQALLSSEKRCRSFVETTSEGFLILDKNLTIDFANHALCQMLGYSTAEIQGQSLLAFTTTESTDAMQRQLHLAHIQPHQSADLMLTHKNSNTIYIRFKATTMTDGTGIFAFITDITEQRKNVLQLKKLSSAVEHSASSIIITDKRGVIEYVNPRFCKVTGYSQEEAIGQRPSLISTQETPSERYQEMWATILAGKDWHGDIYNRTKDGASYWSQMSISPITDSHGEISNFISVSEDITEHKDQQLKMEKLALYDPLTGLANRRLIKDRLEQACNIIRRQQNKGIGLIMLDLDHFKSINDTYGHDIGDELLKLVAQRLRACVRKEDTVSRPGGDEFMILVQEVNSDDDIRPVADKIRQALRRPMLLGEHQLQITASIGVAMAPMDAIEPKNLTKCADLALYQVKETGRDNYRFFADTQLPELEI